MNAPQTLLIIARVTHYQHQGRFYSYTPYAREIEVWADLFPQVLIAGTLRHGPPPADCAVFAHENIAVLPVIEAGGDGLQAKLKQLFLLPLVMAQLIYYILRADAVQVRCPCDLGFLGVLLAPLCRRRLIAKYATQWLPFAGEPLAWRWQRWFLKSKWWRGPVTVYGQWPNQPSKVTPFFNSMLSEQHMARARLAACRPRPSDVLRVLYVGRLSAAKNVHILLHAVAQAQTPNRRIICTIVGEGPERTSLEQLAAKLGLAAAGTAFPSAFCNHQVEFTGGLNFDQVLCYYERADMLVLASDIEGWPKVVAEAMAFGLVCVGSERGLMPQMLGEGRGLLVPPRNIQALRAALEHIAAHPAEAAVMGAQAAAWAQRFTIEGLREAFRQLLVKHWRLSDQMSLGPSRHTAPPHLSPNLNL